MYQSGDTSVSVIFPYHLSSVGIGFPAYVSFLIVFGSSYSCTRILDGSPSSIYVVVESCLYTVCCHYYERLSVCAVEVGNASPFIGCACHQSVCTVLSDVSYSVFREGICQGSVCTRVHFSGCITCRGFPVVSVVGILVPQGRNTVLVRQGFFDKQSCFRVIYLVSLQFLSVETCGCGAYLPFQCIVVGLDKRISCFCCGYAEQSGFFGAAPCGCGLFLSAVRIGGLQKVSPFIIFIPCGSSLVVCIA